MQLPRLERDDLEKGCRGARILAGNDYEFGMMAEKLGMTEAELRALVPITVMTRGEAGSLITVGDEKFEIPAAKCRKVVDPTGAGDAFRSGFVLGYKRKLPWPVVGRLAALTAVYAVEQHGPQQHAYTLQEFLARYRENFGSSSEIGDLAGGRTVGVTDPRVLPACRDRARRVILSRDRIDSIRTARSGADDSSGAAHSSMSRRKAIILGVLIVILAVGSRAGVAIPGARRRAAPGRQRGERADGRPGRQLRGYAASAWAGSPRAKRARSGSARAGEGPLKLEFTQKGNPLTGFKVDDFDPTEHRRDGSRLVLVVKSNQVERYVEEDDSMKSPPRMLDRLMDWIRDELHE